MSFLLPLYVFAIFVLYQPNYSIPRYPYCIVWCPIPCLTWLFPFIGHMGICMSSGDKQKKESMPRLVTILGHHFITLPVSNPNKSKFDNWKVQLFRCCSRLCWSLLCIWGQHGFWQTCQVLEAWSCKVSSCLFLDPAIICWVFSGEGLRKIVFMTN